MSDTCAWCGAHKTSDPVCYQCGANYAKAEAIKARGSAKGVARTETAAAVDEQDTLLALVRDPHAEWLNCLLALPLMLLGAWACQYFNIFDGFQRIVFGMPVHELGHAITAWFTGHNAMPTLWLTRISPERGYLCSLLLLGVWIALWRLGSRMREPRWYAVVIVLVLLQLYGTFKVRAVDTEMWITFGGDGIGMVLATLLMGSFYFGKSTPLYKGSVRWGLLFWGAAAFMDIFMAWWEGQSDIARVGYGSVNGNHSDAYKLINEYVWNWEEMISTYLQLGYACLAVLAGLYVFGLWQARQWLKH